MWRRFYIGESATVRIAVLRCAAAIIAFAVLWIWAVDLRARAESKDWIVLNNCRLIANPANDGDSFHVSAGEKEYLFRLYFVDAPETDEMNPARLVEQAKYFGITVPQAIEVGRAAKEFTRAKLSEPFIVFTHMSDAMGHSRLERFYAFVQTKEGDLGEQLVRNGLARIYGFKAVPPGSRNWRAELDKLQQLENQAKREKVGGWRINAGRLATRDASAFFNSEATSTNSTKSKTQSKSPACQREDSARQDRYQYCHTERANDGAGDRTRDRGPHHCSATVSWRRRFEESERDWRQKIRADSAIFSVSAVRFPIELFRCIIAQTNIPNGLLTNGHKEAI